VKHLRAFALFWWDFIVGDSMTLALGAVGVIALAFLFGHSSLGHAGDVLVPAAVIVTLGASLRRR
jgi:hypothetical protein